MPIQNLWSQVLAREIKGGFALANALAVHHWADFQLATVRPPAGES